MNKLKSFLAGIMLIAITGVMVQLVTLIYRSANRISVKTYIFQNNNEAYNRVGALQNIDDMSPIELRNKLIKKYVSDYFRVTPGEDNISLRPEIQQLSSPEAYRQWTSGEALNIYQMSKQNMFRRAIVSDEDIVTMYMPENYDYYTPVVADYIRYKIHYRTETWTEANAMGVAPIYENGVLYLEARFKPGIDKSKNVSEYLKSGADPVGLFMFEVTDIDEEEPE